MQQNNIILLTKSWKIGNLYMWLHSLSNNTIENMIPCAYVALWKRKVLISLPFTWRERWLLPRTCEVCLDPCQERTVPYHGHFFGGLSSQFPFLEWSTDRRSAGTDLENSGWFRSLLFPRTETESGLRSPHFLRPPEYRVSSDLEKFSSHSAANFWWGQQCQSCPSKIGHGTSCPQDLIAEGHSFVSSLP
jgi:hypothetical protein